VEEKIKKCWFYILGFENPEENARSFRCETLHIDNTGIATNYQGEFGEIVITLYTFQEDYKKALKILDRAKAYLEKINKIKFLTLPIPEDWHFVTTIEYDIKELESKKAPYSLIKNQENNIITGNIDFNALEQFINDKIGQNQKWTNKFIKLQKLIKQYEREPKNQKLIQEIIRQSSNLNIFITKD